MTEPTSAKERKEKGNGLVNEKNIKKQQNVIQKQ